MAGKVHLGRASRMPALCLALAFTTTTVAAQGTAPRGDGTPSAQPTQLEIALSEYSGFEFGNLSLGQFTASADETRRTRTSEGFLYEATVSLEGGSLELSAGDDGGDGGVRLRLDGLGLQMTGSIAARRESPTHPSRMAALPRHTWLSFTSLSGEGTRLLGSVPSFSNQRVYGRSRSEVVFSDDGARGEIELTVDGLRLPGAVLATTRVGGLIRADLEARTTSVLLLDLATGTLSIEQARFQVDAAHAPDGPVVLGDLSVEGGTWSAGEILVHRDAVTATDLRIASPRVLYRPDGEREILAVREVFLASWQVPLGTDGLPSAEPPTVAALDGSSDLESASPAAVPSPPQAADGASAGSSGADLPGLPVVYGEERALRRALSDPRVGDDELLPLGDPDLRLARLGALRTTYRTFTAMRDAVDTQLVLGVQVDDGVVSEARVDAVRLGGEPLAPGPADATAAALATADDGSPPTAPVSLPPTVIVEARGTVAPSPDRVLRFVGEVVSPGKLISRLLLHSTVLEVSLAAGIYVGAIAPPLAGVAFAGTYCVGWLVTDSVGSLVDQGIQEGAKALGQGVATLVSSAAPADASQPGFVLFDPTGVPMVDLTLYNPTLGTRIVDRAERIRLVRETYRRFLDDEPLSTRPELAAAARRTLAGAAFVRSRDEMRTYLGQAEQRWQQIQRSRIQSYLERHAEVEARRLRVLRTSEARNRAVLNAGYWESVRRRKEQEERLDQRLRKGAGSVVIDIPLNGSGTQGPGTSFGPGTGGEVDGSDTTTLRYLLMMGSEYPEPQIPMEVLR